MLESSGMFGIDDYITNLKTKSLYRSLKNSDCDYENYIDFSSNDYLGLSHNENSLAAGYEAAKIYGTGSTGSRLLSGNKKIFEQFEEQISADKKLESALIFNSGFIANANVISAFSIPESVLIFDKLNHASMYYGIDATKTKLLRYKHLDYDELESILQKNVECRNKVIASETVFGMDGDVADLEKLIFLAQKYEALLFLDEAHATGLYGKNGCGISTNFNLDHDSTIVMGTFSKALASSGAYVACSGKIKEYLLQKSKGFIYSTALSPFCIGVAQYNWNLLKTDEVRATAQRVIKLADKLRHKVGGTGSNTNIVPIKFDSIEEMLSVHDICLKNKIRTSAVRPPTSPVAKIRLAINAFHTERDLEVVQAMLI
jgi:8-amino-7-oxononanoate synthase